MTPLHFCAVFCSFLLPCATAKSFCLLYRLTAWKAYEFWKVEVNAPSRFNVIWRDGLVYFFAIFSMNLANIVIFIAAPETLRAVNLG